MRATSRAAVAAVFVSALFTAGCIEQKQAPQPAAKQAVQQQQQQHKQAADTTPAPAKKASPGITMKQFRAVDISLQYPDVVKLFGADGTLESQELRNGREYETYVWTNADGSTVTIRFEDGRVQRTSQRGLK